MNLLYIRGVARILEKSGQKCKILDRKSCPLVKSHGGWAGYSIFNVDSPDANPRSALARS